MVTVMHDHPATEGTLAQLIAQARQRVDTNVPGEITIDCSSVTAIRSEMLGRLIRLHLDAQQCQSKLILENVTESVFGVLTLTRLDRMLRIRRDESHKMVPEHHLASTAK